MSAVEEHVIQGRRPSEETAKTRKVVIKYVMQNAYKEISTDEIASATHEDQQRVIAQLRWLESKNIIKKVGKVKTKSGRGRPFALWAINEEGLNQS